MEGWTDRFPLYSTGLCPLRGRCPAPPSTSNTHYLSRARVPLTTYCLWAAIFFANFQTKNTKLVIHFMYLSSHSFSTKFQSWFFWLSIPISSLVQPQIDYCCSSWYSGLTVALRERLNVIQRKVVRFVYGINNREHVDNSNLRELNWLNFPVRVRFFQNVTSFPHTA